MLKLESHWVYPTPSSNLWLTGVIFDSSVRGVGHLIQTYTDELSGKVSVSLALRGGGTAVFRFTPPESFSKERCISQEDLDELRARAIMEIGE